MPSSDSKTCAFCSKDGASRLCVGCNGAPDPTSTGLIKTLYCDAFCQKAHWNTHKIACKAHRARRILYRLGETAQMAFYIFRENAYDQNIERVEIKENSLLLHEGYYDDGRILFPFPHHLLRDEQDKQAALTFLTCGDAIAHMHELFSIMLKGTCPDVVEVLVRPQPPKRPMQTVRPDGPNRGNDCPHVILMVTLKDGEMYAVDVTGAQYGYYDSVYPWDQYLQTRVQTSGQEVSFRSFGSLKTKYHGAVWCATPGYKGAVRTAHREFATTFDRAVDEWQGKGVKVVEMLRMGAEAFVRARGELMGCVAGALQEFKRGFDGRNMVGGFSG